MVKDSGELPIFYLFYRGVGKGCNIGINAATLSLTDGAVLSAATEGVGNAGNINVVVTGAVNIAGQKNGSGISTIVVGTGTVGNGGNINIDALD